LWIDHGQAPTDDTYGYVVYAGEGLPAAELPFEVLRNDTQVQALASRDGRTVEAVFYTADAALASPRGELTVSAPCALLLDGDRLTVTDARMDPDCREIVVTCAGRRIPIAMPQGILCGKPETPDLRITE
ncbi:MAG: polysaccharide lyase, partial [Alistipes sp.]|nr:polysaccharide lyase [Alistipes sp.]